MFDSLPFVRGQKGSLDLTREKDQCFSDLNSLGEKEGITAPGP